MRTVKSEEDISKKDYKLGKEIHDGMSGVLYNMVLNKNQY